MEVLMGWKREKSCQPEVLCCRSAEGRAECTYLPNLLVRRHPQLDREEARLAHVVLPVPFAAAEADARQQPVGRRPVLRLPSCSEDAAQHPAAPAAPAA